MHIRKREDRIEKKSYMTVNKNIVQYSLLGHTKLKEGSIMKLLGMRNICKVDSRLRQMAVIDYIASSEYRRGMLGSSDPTK